MNVEEVPNVLQKTITWPKKLGKRKARMGIGIYIS
jgi:hypothetical protein